MALVNELCRPNSEGREELVAEISYRMKGSGEENLRLLAALEIEKQPTGALRNWLLYLKRARIDGGEPCGT